ncbi:MAG: ComF family protein [Burkholderiaceae bacterium]
MLRASPRVAAVFRTVAPMLRRWFAHRCAVCGIAPGAPVCAGCAADFFPPGVTRCAQCGLRLTHTGDAMICGRCLREPPRYDATLALADYAPPVDGMLIALKFRHRLQLARVFGELLAARLGDRLPREALLAPVPLAFERHAERGFNQAREIARTVAHRLALPLAADALVRIKHGVPQEALTLDARRRNVRGAFAARADVRGRTVVVVDDVMTSGATLDEIAAVLKRAGATRVVNLVVARTP